MSRAPIWVVRPEPGNRATIRRLAALGLPGKPIPLFRGEPVAWTAPDPQMFDVLMLTSANAVRHAGPALLLYSALPVWAVGEATAAAVRDAGLPVARTGTAGVAELLHGAQGRILWLCGEERTEPPLRAGTVFMAVPVYRMVETPVSAGDFDTGGIILLHSARAAQRIAALIGPRRATFTLVAISAEVAAAAGSGWHAVHLPERPGDTEMVAVAARLCQ